jgi:hypothetical protein
VKDHTPEKLMDGDSSNFPESSWPSLPRAMEMIFTMKEQDSIGEKG